MEVNAVGPWFLIYVWAFYVTKKIICLKKINKKDLFLWEDFKFETSGYLSAG